MQGNNQVEVLDKICSIHEQLQREIHRYKEEEPGSMLPWSDRRKPLRVLVLYSGTGSVEHAILQRYPNAITVSVDLNPAFNPTHCCSVRETVDGGSRRFAELPYRILRHRVGVSPARAQSIAGLRLLVSPCHIQ